MVSVCACTSHEIKLSKYFLSTTVVLHKYYKHTKTILIKQLIHLYQIIPIIHHTSNFFTIRYD